ncbi:uncharacterized protein LOC109711691 isoform X4 [Ananas comosus]|uniref:Uncharacterized protein LOC109711691 isoform X4 n=1 Tax=Ananas comosus TaxID=4615 RepID=A0A6P5F3B1_ANACO|nr:uncharacterized protein LOC109711691 isoform X4 [Ananas comosus]
MLCLKAEALAHEMFASHGVILPVNLGSSVQRAMRKVGRRRSAAASRRSHPPPVSSSGDASASCSGVEDDKSNGSGRNGGNCSQKMLCYRSQLEQEVNVNKLQRQLQEEIDLHMALANAVAHNTVPLLNSPTKIPDKAQELLANIASLESTVSKLEEELAALHSRLSHERNERLLAETHLRCLRSSTSGSTWEESISSLRNLKSGASRITPLRQQDLLSEYEDQQLDSGDILLGNKEEEEEEEEEEVLGSSFMVREEGKKMDGSMLQPDETEIILNNMQTNLWKNPNHLSEEMVRCMRNIYLCLSESSKISPKASSSECSSSLLVGHLSGCSLQSFSDWSVMPSMLHSLSLEPNNNDGITDQVKWFDPYRVNGRVWREIGSFSLAAEVSWMSVGKAQLDYATEALRKFRFLVEQLAKVNPACMSCDERLAFWINLYNALIMHAYLAYGFPRSDIKLFSLMQKACYTVGGQSFSAADIEFVILKMKAPTHRPQLFKITEEHRKYSIDNPEPLILFALSCGMFSSPAVKIFSAKNVHDELQNSMRDYIRASIGISEKGKLLVPKLLHGFAKGVVEDSMLVDWICRYLCPDQIAIIRNSASLQRKHRLLGVRSFNTIPFNSRFRYLFLPDNSFESSSKCGENGLFCN